MATIRSRAEFVAAETIMRGTAKPALHELKRGVLYIDAANISGFADGQLIGTILGIPLKRKAALADGKYQYYDDAATPNLLASN